MRALCECGGWLRATSREIAPYGGTQNAERGRVAAGPSLVTLSPARSEARYRSCSRSIEKGAVSEHPAAAKKSGGDED
jgi:hypothetical protein